ncbi:MAG: hypothetical protein P9M14_06985 [Candidatus Alcyoniella australis]|nr:hypothetical protein [Candidatus Alcyoniella australis]
MDVIPVDPRIEEYIDSQRQSADPPLLEMERLAAQRDFPIVGPQVGMLLHMLVKLGGARNVLELGSGFGYSAYWIAKALPGLEPGAKLASGPNSWLNDNLRDAV